VLYHSFPRPRRDKWDDPNSPDKNPSDKGIKILENILRYGLLLVPEKIDYPYKTDTEGKKSPTFNLIQCRFCLTALEDIAKLEDHAKFFGDIHLEFTEESVYAMGAIPVMYVPKAPSNAEPTSLWHLAFSFIHRLSDLQTIASMLEYLDDAATNYAHEEEISLKADIGNAKEIKVAQLRDILELILGGVVDTRLDKDKKKAEFTQIQGAIQGFSSLFYFTDDVDRPTELLHYFWQREWRIVQGISINGNVQDRELTYNEKEATLGVDEKYFGFVPVFDFCTGRHRRIDMCRLLPEINSKPIQEFINRILIPSNLYKQAISIAQASGFPETKIISHTNNYKELQPETEKKRNIQNGKQGVSLKTTAHEGRR